MVFYIYIFKFLFGYELMWISKKNVNCIFYRVMWKGILICRFYINIFLKVLKYDWCKIDFEFFFVLRVLLLEIGLGFYKINMLNVDLFIIVVICGYLIF